MATPNNGEVPATSATDDDARPDETIGYTSDQSLWRAATILADHEGPPAAVSELDDAPSLTPGAPADFAARYQLREVLGAGGMGEVRLCRDEGIGRDVALKTLRDASDARTHARRRFLREVRIQGQLEHPSIVPVYDLGVGPEGGPYFTMRRVRGHTLADVLTALTRGDAAAQASYTRRKLLGAYVQVCLAVDYAHTRGVLHRDLKPSNIMLGDYGEVYVLDWGVARLVAERATTAPVVVPQTELAGQGSVVGTPGYMAPEQILGLADAQDARTDVYALGAILYEVLTLRPLRRGNLQQVASATLAGVEAQASTAAPDVPPELDAICARATSRDRAARFATARELAEAIERYLDGDRDLTRRREQADRHVQAARAAVARAHGADAATREAARAEAMREVLRALSLAAEQPDARGLLAQMLLEVPSDLPPAVETEMTRATAERQQHTARFGVYALVSWAATIPFVAAIGVLDWASFLAASVLCVLSALHALWVWRTQPTRGHLIVFAALVAATCGALSCWLGPFVLVPTAGATTTIWITLHASPGDRWYLAAIGGLGIFLPFVLEVVGWVPRSFSFEAGRLVLHARALRLEPTATTLALLYSSVTFCSLQPLLLGGIRDALSAAERKLYLQAWHLRQLAPEQGTTKAAA